MLPLHFCSHNYEGHYEKSGTDAETAYIDRTRYWATEWIKTKEKVEKPDRVVLADLLRDEYSLLVVPLLSYNQGVYRSESYVIELIGDKGKADIVKARENNILNRVKSFQIFNRGQNVGSFSTTQVIETQLGCLEGIAGAGNAEGNIPAELKRTFALSKGAARQDFWVSSDLTESQRRTILSLAMKLVPSAMLEGKKIVYGKPRIKDAEILEKLSLPLVEVRRTLFLQNRLHQKPQDQLSQTGLYLGIPL